MKCRILGILILLPALAVGGVLRLYLLPDQVLLDDEWHALNFVIGGSFGELFVKSPWIGATGAPLNVYTLFLLQNAGWSESLLRLPAIVAGLCSLIVLPLLVRNLFGQKVAFAFSWLLAISPFLVFYSRVARPYAVVVLLGTTSVLAFWTWATAEKGKWWWAVISALTGITATWFHIFASIGVIAPMVWAVGYRVFLKYSRPTSEETAKSGPPSIRRLAWLFTSVLVLSAALLVPSLLDSSDSKFAISTGQGHVELATLAGSAEIMCGSENAAWAAAFWGIALIGTARLSWKTPMIAGGIVLSLATYILAFVLLKPTDIHAFIVMCRYGILFVPMLLIAAACGIETLVEFARFVPLSGRAILFYVTAIVFACVLLALGPLGRAYKRPNNFTNHSAFQESYRKSSTNSFYVSQITPLSNPVTRDDAPKFYLTLAEKPDVKTVIEYPMMIGDHVNLLYFYQQIHRKNVKVGYAPKPPRAKTQQRSFAWGDDSPDAVLGQVPDRKQLRFRNMIDLSDLERVRTSGANLLILHKDLTGEWSARQTTGRPSRTVLLIARTYSGLFGPPVFEDDQLIVFNLKQVR